MKKRYRFRDKARAFARGLIRFKPAPLVEVACAGIKRDIPDKQKNRYLRRIAKSGNTEQVYELLDKNAVFVDQEVLYRQRSVLDVLDKVNQQDLADRLSLIASTDLTRSRSHVCANIGAVLLSGFEFFGGLMVLFETTNPTHIALSMLPLIAVRFNKQQLQARQVTAYERAQNLLLQKKPESVEVRGKLSQNIDQANILFLPFSSQIKS
jgi:hypothetical protein